MLTQHAEKRAKYRNQMLEEPFDEERFRKIFAVENEGTRIAKLDDIFHSGSKRLVNDMSHGFIYFSDFM